jgi:hypothetical protein
VWDWFEDVAFKIIDVFASFFAFACLVGVFGFFFYGVYEACTSPEQKPVHSMVGTITDKGWNAKPLVYWIDVNGGEFNTDKDTWDMVSTGEKVRVIYQDNEVLKIEHVK